MEEKLKQYNQEHLLYYYDELSTDQKASLMKQIEGIDFELLNLCKDGTHVNEQGKIEPIEVMKQDEIEKRKDEFFTIGAAAIKAGKVGAILLAGGQGTRLGLNKPKGMLNVGINKSLFLFERLIYNIMDVVNKVGAYIPLLIMTSDKNYEDTVAFFKEHQYFGYDQDFIDFFIQDMAPSVNFEGKILLEGKDQISLSPNGNGGWLSSLSKCGLLGKIKKSGVEWLNVFSVDNVLQRISDPYFIGATIDSGYPAGSKVVRKVSPDERVGVMCKENGKPSIIEYFELTDQLMNAKDKSGEPAYNYGVILNYLFRIAELEDIINHHMPQHIVEKKIPYINEKAELINPDEVNGYKFETLILDMINMLDGCLPYEVDRNKEFAPIKNSVGVDSLESARELLKENGVVL